MPEVMITPPIKNMQDAFSVKGKNVIVTGGSRGIGRGIVQAVSFMAGTAYPELLESDNGTSSDGGDGDTSSSASSLPEGTPEGTLKFGDEGDDVLRLQYRLQELGYLFVNPTGLYAEGTEQSVKDFQLLNGMLVTGVADEETLALLFSDEAKPRN